MAMNISPQKQTSHLKREILVRLIKAYLSDDFQENTRLIPYDMRPKGHEVPFRCCIHNERAILRDRAIAGLGFSIEETEDYTLLSELAQKAENREEPENNPLTVLTSACKGCVPSRIYVTDLCQGCVARPCVNTCKFGAISVINGKSTIDPTKCKNCGMCAQVCPYQAIQKIIVPCENACPVGAIAKDENGHAKIDFDKCISCGKCASACPFGAVHEKSQIIDVLKHIKAYRHCGQTECDPQSQNCCSNAIPCQAQNEAKPREVIAMVAPAMFGQLPCSPKQLKDAILKLGFSEVYEVAQGADITTKNEAAEFVERMEKGEKFMTTSCCAGYNELVDKHIPEMKPFRSDTQTPTYYTAEIVKREHPGAVTVFFSPCVAKKREALKNPNVDYVLNYEEVGAWMIALGIQVSECDEQAFDTESSAEARNFCVTGGVAKAVATILPEEVPANPVVIDGLNKQSVRDLKKYAKNGVCELGNLIEVMSCQGGCLGGNSTVNAFKPALKQVTAYVNESPSIKEQISL